MAPKESYYAVANGRNIGVFRTWAEAFQSTNGFPNNRHKRFNTFQEAQDFIRDYQIAHGIIPASPPAVRNNNSWCDIL